MVLVHLIKDIEEGNCALLCHFHLELDLKTIETC